MGREDDQKDVKTHETLKQKEFRLYADFKSVKKEDDGFIYIEGYASTFTEDLDGETVDPKAFDDTLNEYGKNPVVLADHKNEVRSVVGKVVNAKVDTVGLWVKVQLSNAKDEFTSMVREKVQEGLLRAFSIGGLFEYDYPIIKRVRLLEISIVGIPANPNALFSLSKAWKGLEIEERKTVSGSTDLPLADREREWDASAAKKRIFEWAGGDDFDPAKVRRAFFWYDSENPNNKTAYKLPFADVIDGKLTAIPRGIFAVAAVLQGSRGGVDIPENDVSEIKRKVERYYSKMREQFNDDSIVPPWNKKLDISVEEPEKGGDSGQTDYRAKFINDYVKLITQKEAIIYGLGLEQR